MCENAYTDSHISVPLKKMSGSYMIEMPSKSVNTTTINNNKYDFGMDNISIVR